MLSSSGYTVGIDEVGRGCLAGPVAAAAVLMPADFCSGEIRDSKKLSVKKRERLCAEIRKYALSIGIGAVCSAIIDKVGIVTATKQAMQMALAELLNECAEKGHRVDQIVVDAVKLNNVDIPLIHPYKADDTYLSVACASIVAKVYRDQIMSDLAKRYTVYGWEKNMGYGTAAHIAAIVKIGITPLHRRTFIKNFSVPE